jgi:hypothetical protein
VGVVNAVSLAANLRDHFLRAAAHLIC